MKKTLSGIILALVIIMTSLPTYAANTQIKMDGIAITSDVAPVMRNNRLMVPLRVVSENLGAKVNWEDSKITLTKNDMQVILKLNSKTVMKNGNPAPLLDAKPYMKNNRAMVPLRFIAETFGCKVDYKNSTVSVETEPLVIDGVEVKALQQEYHMTMGGVVQQIRGNAINEEIYNIFMENKGNKVEAPANYSWMINIDTPGAYYKVGQFDFLNIEGKSIKQFDIYMLVESFPAETLECYPKVLIYDANENQWYLFNEAASQSINQLVDTASKNGLLEIISNTVV